MNASGKALLPTGLADLLPPQAEREDAATRTMLDCFAEWGYERIKPPLLEFEDGLLDGVGAVHAEQTFRVMDPASRRMLGVRADITPQAARIAASRLSRAPRPLRLCYAGEVLRVRGSEWRAERQFRQVGVELIGAGNAAKGDAETILLAAEAIDRLGIGGLSVDLNTPTLAAVVCDAFAVPGAERRQAAAALRRRDGAALRALDGPAIAPLDALLAATGAAAPAVARLARAELPTPARVLADRLCEVVELVAAEAPKLALTVDPVESRGFEYHTGVSFTLFARGQRGELGSGGRYRIASDEPATGFTMFIGALLRALPETPGMKRVFLPVGAPRGAAARLRAEGWAVLQALMPEPDPADEARRLGCGHVWADGAVRRLKP